jgi:hypothetical protein
MLKTYISSCAEKDLYIKLNFESTIKFLVKMSILLKNFQGIMFLTICVVYLLHIIWPVDEVTDRYFFDRNLGSRQLKLHIS